MEVVAVDKLSSPWKAKAVTLLTTASLKIVRPGIEFMEEINANDTSLLTAARSRMQKCYKGGNLLLGGGTGALVDTQ